MARCRPGGVEGVDHGGEHEIDDVDARLSHHRHVRGRGIRGDRHAPGVTSHVHSPFGPESEVDHRDVERAPVRHHQPSTIGTGGEELGNRPHPVGVVDGPGRRRDPVDEARIPVAAVAVVIGDRIPPGSVELVVRDVDMGAIRRDGGLDGRALHPPLTEAEIREFDRVVDDGDDRPFGVEHGDVVAIHHVLRDESSVADGHDALGHQTVVTHHELTLEHHLVRERSGHRRRGRGRDGGGRGRRRARRGRFGGGRDLEARRGGDRRGDRGRSRRPVAHQILAATGRGEKEPAHGQTPMSSPNSHHGEGSPRRINAVARRLRGTSIP